MTRGKYKLSQEGMQELMLRLGKRARELGVDISTKELLKGTTQEEHNGKPLNEPKKGG